MATPDAEPNETVDLDAFADACDPLIIVGLVALVAPLVGAHPVTGFAIGCSIVGCVLVIQAAGQYARRGVDAVRSRPRMDNRASHETNLKAGAGATAVASAAAIMVENHGLVYVVKNFGIGGLLTQLFISAIGIMQGAAETFMKPLRAFAGGVADVVAAVFPARIINAGADFTAFSLTRGDWAFFGPGTFAVSVVATLAGIGVFLWFLRKYDLSAFGALFSRR